MNLENDINLLQEAGLDIIKGAEYTGGGENYISAVQRFLKNHNKNRQKVLEYYNSRDYNNYMITVHALKSNAKMIGATSLSIVFEELEAASKEGNTNIIETKTGSALTMYDELIERLKPLGEMAEVHPADEISADEAKDITSQLISALDDFDDSLAKELAGKLTGYPFRITQREQLKKATELIEDFMYEDAAELIGLIIPNIE